MKFIVLFKIHLGGKCKISWSNDDLDRFLNLSGPRGPWQIGLTLNRIYLDDLDIHMQCLIEALDFFKSCNSVNPSVVEYLILC